MKNVQKESLELTIKINKKVLTARTKLSILLSPYIYEILYKFNPNYQYYEAGERIGGVCPVHDGSDNVTAFTYYIDSGLWFCWSRGCHEKNGHDLIGLIATKLDVSVGKAILKASNFLKLKEISTKDKEKLYRKFYNPPKVVNYWQQHLEQKTYNISCLKRLKNDNKFLYNRGLDIELCKKIGAGLAVSGKMNGRIVFPVKNSVSKIVGFTGRSIESWRKPKWLHSSFKSNLNLFNINRALKYIRRSNSVLIVEGPFDIVKLNMARVYNVVASLGARVSKAQSYILQNCGVIKIFLGFDPDKFDAPSTNGTIYRLKDENFDVIQVKWKGDDDWGEMRIGKIRRILANMERE